ncbi:hypothetical protein ACJMK2_008071 [Sinanodonta woodiana]|uniref:Uncharacterized protein n=1 Tax=Sinanodonta woodiana TaxID=1069815 RepID=A0ABD3VLN5_SINWO
MFNISTVRFVHYSHINASLITCYCIVVHVTEIIPYGKTKEFPSRIKDVPVDVREGKFVPYSNVPGAMKYHQCILMGCQIVRCNGSNGTLGGFLDLEGGGIGIRTCAHVALTEEERNTHLDSSPDEQLHEHKSIPWKTPRMGQPDEYLELDAELKLALKPGCLFLKKIGLDAAVVTITDMPLNWYLGHFPESKFSFRYEKK